MGSVSNAAVVRVATAGTLGFDTVVSPWGASPGTPTCGNRPAETKSPRPGQSSRNRGSLQVDFSALRSGRGTPPPFCGGCRLALVLVFARGSACYAELGMARA